jgi:hypothetical protein
MQVLYGLAVRILNNIPILSAGTSTYTIELPIGTTPDHHHKSRFLFGLCQRGVIRFPKQYWVAALAEISSPWGNDVMDRRKLVQSFFDVFTMGRTKVDHADLALLRPIPFVYESAGGEVYVDFTATFDFLAWIIDRAKEWYSSQHGDHFTLAVKRFIEQRSDARVIAQKRVLRKADGKFSEVDLLVYHGDCLYVIECKAYAKSRSFFRGDYEAVQQRRRRIREGVQQAVQAAEAVRFALASGELTVSGTSIIQWILCTPTQEFLHPHNEYGFVRARIPPVCTPEELIRLLS